MMPLPAQKEKGPKNPRKKKDWVLKDEPLDHSALTAPESLMALRFKTTYPSLYKHLRRSNAPYKGSGYKSDFTIEVDHYHYDGVVIEIQGGIYSRRRTGHSSSTGLKRDYNKVTLAQLNRWFILQVAPDDMSILDACDKVDEIIQRLVEENDENEHVLQTLEEAVRGG